MKYRYLAVTMAIGLAVAMGAFADSITVAGRHYDNVYIIQSASRYYVQLPNDGRVLSFAKSDVPDSAVTISANSAHRAALLHEWTKNNAKRQARLYPALAASSATTDAPTKSVPDKLGHTSHFADPPNHPIETAKLAPVASRTPYADRYIYRLSLKDVPLAIALKALLKPLNLEYQVRNGYIWISSPERIRKEAWENLRTRVYQLNNAGAETLPKIVVSNPGGPTNAAALGGGVANNAAAGRGAMGVAGYGRPGFAGGGVRVGFGGGTGGGGRGFMFTNISQLFSRIDDRLVGEPPAIIGLQIIPLG